MSVVVTERSIMNRKLLYTGVAIVSAVFISTPPAYSVERSELAELKQMLAEMRNEYESRISALENRIKRAESKVIDTENRLKMTKHISNGIGQFSDSKRPQMEPQVKSSTQSRDNLFNPAISFILQGSGVRYSRDQETWHLPGFQTGGEAGLKEEGLSLTETELKASVNVDDWFYGEAMVGLHEHEGDTEVHLEEAFLDTLNLPLGVGLRFGRFFTKTGYLNTQHSHEWDFSDAPLTSQAFLGKQYYDDGLRLSWLAPTDTFLEFGMEALRGREFPANGNHDRWVGGAKNYFMQVGNDIGSEHSFLFGLSHLRTEPDDRGSNDHGHSDGEQHGTFQFSGDSDLTVANLIWKWAPDGNPEERNFIFQTEYFYRDEDGALQFNHNTDSASLFYDGTQEGFYTQGIYQFLPGWRVGLRYDRLWTDNTLRIIENNSDEEDEELLEESGLSDEHDPYRWTLMADYSHSEFSRLRLQYTNDYSRSGDSDDQFHLQYIMSLGSHPAHEY